MTPGAGDALKAAGKRAQSNLARQKQLSRLRASWVSGSELTPAQLERIQPTLREQFYAREERRAA